MPIRDKCVFSLVFSPVNQSGIGPKRQQAPPRGFVIKPPLNAKRRYDPGETIVFDFLLIGPLSNYLPYVIVPFKELGQWAIGMRRGKFSFAMIDAIKADGSAVPVYREADGVVRSVVPIEWGDLARSFSPPADGRVTLRFLTPAHIRFNPTGAKGKSRPVRAPEFFHIACRPRDRISALCREYGPEPLEMDFKGFGERAKDIRTVESNLRWIEGSRVSRTRHRHDLSGFVGDITFQGDLSEFWSFLVLGQFVHMGDNAVLGGGGMGLRRQYRAFSAHLLPDSSDRVLYDKFVRCQYGQSVNDGLTDQHAIKGVVVELGESPKVQSSLFFKSKCSNAVLFSLCRNDSLRWFRQRQSSQGMFYGNFPCGNSAEVHFVCSISKQLAGRV